MTDDLFPQQAGGRDLVKGALAGAVAALLVALVAVAGWGTFARTSKSWSPLGPFPLQTVVHPECCDDIDPVINVHDGHVSVVAVKCRGDNVLQVETVYAWHRISPPGLAIAGDDIPAVIEPAGCTTTQYHNDIPAAVADNVCTHGSSVWQLVGSETPIGYGNDNGQIVARAGGASLGWETAPFILTCEEQPL
ncbi:MAG: hypothetical protein GY929_24155 [Actinomycetia bacterium]|nr:hypothetical protein [Actinomycetes bacterium]